MKKIILYLLILFSLVRADEVSRLESLAKLQKVLSIVENYYVDDINFSDIVDKTIAGLMSNLDAHSSYMNKKAFKEMNIQMNGEFGGLGIVISIKKGALTVISPIDDTPAYKAGIKAGDIILKIDNKSTLDMTLQEAVNLMRGKPNTDIVLTIVRKNEPKPLKIKITRGIIKVKSVKAKLIKPDILYLRVSSFDKNVAKHLKKFITKYKKETKGIILDLRNNPGGALSQAIATVDIFVDNGVIVSQKGRIKSQKKDYKATKKATLTKVPLVVLINSGSASASEIVSGALQDFKRAVIVGENSFGKGSVQLLIPITQDQSEAIKLTIARYYLPSGRTIQAKGVVPDVISYPGEAPKPKENEFVLKEKELKRHLVSELEKIDGKKSKKEENKKDKNVITQKEILKDNQLNTAVNILKALILVK